MAAISSESLRKITEFDLMDCGNTAWSFAKLTVRNEEVYSCLLGRIFDLPVAVDDQAVHALCCTTWTASHDDLTWELMERRTRAGLGLDATSYGFLLMHAHWHGQQFREVQVLELLAAGMLVEVLQPTIRRWITLTRFPHIDYSARNVLSPSQNDERSWYRYQKLGRLVHFIEATALAGNPQSMLLCIEGFVKEAHHRWLKIAGGPKAQVIDAATQLRPLREHEVGVEMGCFVGYTATRLGWRLGGTGFFGAMLRLGVLSTELDAVHVCISRHHIDAARLSVAAEVWPGHIPWVTPRYVEEFGSQSIGFNFMDHKGTRFHEDLGDCRALEALAPFSRLLCDNVLKPGAPVHLWIHHRSCDGLPSAAVWLLHEFLEPECEDWQSLRDEPPPRLSG